MGAFGDDRNWARRSVHGRHVGISPSRLDWVAGPLGGEEEVQVVQVVAVGNQLGHRARPAGAGAGAGAGVQQALTPGWTGIPEQWQTRGHNAIYPGEGGRE